MEHELKLRILIRECLTKLTEKHPIQEVNNKSNENDEDIPIELPPTLEDTNEANLDELDALPPPIELNNY